jgi:hypothetical protein
MSLPESLPARLYLLAYDTDKERLISRSTFCQQFKHLTSVCGLQSPWSRIFVRGDPVTKRSRTLLLAAGNPRFTEDAIARNSLLADFVVEVAEEIEASPAQVALAWLRSRGVTAIPGARRTQRLAENRASQDIVLRAERLDRFESFINQGLVGDRF